MFTDSIQSGVKFEENTERNKRVCELKVKGLTNGAIARDPEVVRLSGGVIISDGNVSRIYNRTLKRSKNIGGDSK